MPKQEPKSGGRYRVNENGERVLVEPPTQPAKYKTLAERRAESEKAEAEASTKAPPKPEPKPAAPRSQPKEA